ncbi:MAG: GDSL-type esterase/lipase family protein [Actinomycetota bacterium]
MKRLLAIVLLAVIVIAGFVGSFITFRKHGLPRHGELLALGDSIAAGAGLGPASGYPDNILAYPAALEDALGWSGFDFAITGACAMKPSDPGADPGTRTACVHSVLSDELPRASSILPRPPDVVVMTIGGNDLDFANCGLELLGSFLVHLNACAGSVLEQRVGVLEANLSTVLAKLHEVYPKARVYVTSYFNPLPAPSAASACSIYNLVAAIHSPFSVLLNRSGSAARQTQAELFQRAEVVLDALNQAIRSSVVRAKDHVVALDFVGHDFCQANASDAWIFGPEIHVSVRTGVIAKRWDYLLPYPCPNDSGKSPPISTHGPVTVHVSGIRITYDATISNNCMPHPTRAGQEAIAQAIVTALLV